MTDRTTRILLTLIAVALWGLLLRPVVSASPTLAAPQSSGCPALVVTQFRDGGDHNVYVVQDGRLYRFTANDLRQMTPLTGK